MKLKMREDNAGTGKYSFTDVSNNDFFLIKDGCIQMHEISKEDIASLAKETDCSKCYIFDCKNRKCYPPEINPMMDETLRKIKNSYRAFYEQEKYNELKKVNRKNSLLSIATGSLVIMLIVLLGIIMLLVK